jgi:hypothetical protein
MCYYIRQPFLWNPKMYYHVYKRYPIDPILKKKFSLHCYTVYFKINFSRLLSFHLCPSLPSDLFPSGVSNTILEVISDVLMNTVQIIE